VTEGPACLFPPPSEETTVIDPLTAARNQLDRLKTHFGLLAAGGPELPRESAQDVARRLLPLLDAVHGNVVSACQVAGEIAHNARVIAAATTLGEMAKAKSDCTCAACVARRKIESVSDTIAAGVNSILNGTAKVG
jgi:hypothetical protein